LPVTSDDLFRLAMDFHDASSESPEIGETASRLGANVVP